MVTHFVEALQGAEWLGVVMLILAVLSFAFTVIWALRLPAAEVERCGRLPLETPGASREDRP
jgi:hypothetical protein